MSDQVKPGTKAWVARQARWRHNAFLGGAAMAKANMNSILASGTATPEAKRTAGQILVLAQTLQEQLATRNPGT